MLVCCGLDLLSEFLRRNPTLAKEEVAQGVITEAIERINEIQALLDSTIGQKDSLNKLWNALAEDLAKFESISGKSADEIGLNRDLMISDVTKTR